MIRAYWYRGEGGLNLGDALNPILFRRLAGRTLEWAPPPEADLFGIGSNMEMIPLAFRGTILGTGISRPDTRRDFSKANVLAVRGNLTAACCHVDPPLLADPGLLGIDLLDCWPEKDINHAFVPHFADFRHVRGYRIDILGGPEHVIREIARCRQITSSSLHGLVIADTLGIPSRWNPYRSTIAVKFEDYVSAYGEILKPYVWRLADQNLVSQKIIALRRLVKGFAK